MDLEVSEEARSILKVIHKVYGGYFGGQKAIDYVRGMVRTVDEKYGRNDEFIEVKRRRSEEEMSS